ncbi:DUF2334 domain-containing protein [Pseudomonas sp. NPDC089734]|uniref:DUF2334 domain-containing protein n=1 Tax=Pseudomonas sp. NPDC089734 TaxID=3364469 RepID=UPI00380AFBDF
MNLQIPRSVLLVLHDVAPSTWADYQAFVAAVDALGSIPITWLVVPDFHKHDPLEHDPQLRKLLQQRLERGDELVLHGYHHCDEGPTPRSLREYVIRRLYTWEGEFSTLNCQQALTRLESGIELFRRHDWPLHGFVAPAWLMSPGTREALRQLPLRYTSDPQHLYRLPDFTGVDAPGLVWSARSAWRRGASKLIGEYRLRQLQEAPTIRLGLHPVDMRHAFSRDYWLATLERLLKDGRQPMTKIGWLNAQASLSDS